MIRRDLFYRLAGTGVTVLVSRHVMDEAGRCELLLLLREADLLAGGSPRSCAIGLAATTWNSDKTGTLTTAEMTVQAIWAAGRTHQVTGIGYAPDGAVQDPELVRELLRVAALCCDAWGLPPPAAWKIAMSENRQLGWVPSTRL